MHVMPKSMPIIFSGLQVLESMVKVSKLYDCGSIGEAMSERSDTLTEYITLPNTLQR